MISRNGQYFAALIGIAGWLALLSQLVISIGLMAAQGHGVGFSIWRYLGYFTILTNIATAVMFSCVALNRWPGGKAASASALTACTMHISFVMLVYHPLAYCGYALLRGHFENWYPYPFIDVSQMGLGQSLLNSAMLTLAFLVIGMGFVAMTKFKFPR
jgi:hypothetical protein